MTGLGEKFTRKRATSTMNSRAESRRSFMKQGIRYGVTTNGYSFILFRAITEGVSWRDGEAVVFAGPKIIESDFTTFWNLLSYEAVADGKLDEAFRHHITEVRE